MRNRPIGLGGDALHAAGNDAQALGGAFLGMLIQQLHAQADAQHRLAQSPQAPVEAGALQTHHGASGGADTRQDHATRGADFGRIAADPRRGAQPLQRIAK